MEREKKKAWFGSSSFSWADEVEREEREEDEQQQQQRQKLEAEAKPDPFGAARPREVVLEEKGVDWRKIDIYLDHHHSNLRKDDKKQKDILLSTPSVISSRSKRLDQIQISTSPLVPPLRYPPKNINSLMERIRRGRKDITDVPFVDKPLMLMENSHQKRQVFGDLNGMNGNERRSDCSDMNSRMKKRRLLSAPIQPCPCYQGKQGKQARRK